MLLYLSFYPLLSVILSPISKISHRPKYFDDETLKPFMFIQISLGVFMAMSEWTEGGEHMLGANKGHLSVLHL